MPEDLIEVRFKIEKDADGFPKTPDWEGLKCIQQGNVCEIRSVPFYLKDVAYGDKVLVKKNRKGHLEFDLVQGRGGHSVFRLWLRGKEETPSVSSRN